MMRHPVGDTAAASGKTDAAATAESASPMIEIDDFSYAYPTSSEPVLTSLTMSVAPGEVCAILGPSDAGKSTVASAVAGFVPQMFGGQLDGDIRVDGRSVPATSLADLVVDIGLVLQNPVNQISGAKFTVREELAFGLENLGVAREDMIERIDKVSTDLRITELADRSPYELSGGQQQLVAIASVLVMEPKVVILDEPTSQLDPGGSTLVFEALHALRQSGITILLIEHKLEQIAQFADRAIALVDGRIQLNGSPADVLADPRLPEWGIGATRYTAAARTLAGRGIWPSGMPIPVTLDGATTAFSDLQARTAEEGNT